MHLYTYFTTHVFGEGLILEGRKVSSKIGENLFSHIKLEFWPKNWKFLPKGGRGQKLDLNGRGGVKNLIWTNIYRQN